MAQMPASGPAPGWSSPSAATRCTSLCLPGGPSAEAVDARKNAELIVLDADPLKGIRNTRRIWAVVVGGTLIRRDALDKMLKDVEAAAMRD